MRITIPLLAAFLLTAPLLRAQQGDPMKEIQEIARKVDEQLQEIDKLLLESGQKARTRDQQKELLQKAREHSETADGNIEELIKKLTEMKNQSSSSQSQDQQDQQGKQQQGGQQKPQDGQQQGQSQARRENQTPDFVQQPKQGEQQGQQKPQPQGQKPGEKPQDGQPQGGEEAKDQAENRQGNRQPEPELGAGQPGAGDESWGELQPYLNRLKNRGSAPKVPEKYRKYWQAYLKNKQAGSGK